MKRFLLIIITIIVILCCATLLGCENANTISCALCGENNILNAKYCFNCGYAFGSDIAESKIMGDKTTEDKTTEDKTAESNTILDDNSNKEECNHKWIEATCEKEKYCVLCREIYGSKASHSFSLGKCSECGAFDENYCSEHYYALRTEMQEMDEKLGSIEFIEEKLSLLPADYKDVSDIKEDLIFIKSKYEVFSDAVFRTIMKQIMTDATQEELEEYYVDYAKVRNAYLSLKNSADEYKNWNLVYFADNYVFDSDENGILLAVMVGLWEDSKGNYINIVETETNSLSFGSNLPSNKDSSKSYYYFINGDIIGYQLKSNTDVIVNAYRIMEIANDYIKVYCFKDGYTYKLAKK